MERPSSEERQYVPVKDASLANEDDDSRQTIQTPPDTIFSKAVPVLRPHRSLDDIPGSKTITPAVLRLRLSQLARQTLELEKALKTEASLRANFETNRQQYQQDSKTYRRTRSSYESTIDPFRTLSDPTLADESIANLRQNLIDHRSLFEASASNVRRARQKMQEAQRSRANCERRMTILARPWILNTDTQSLAQSTLQSVELQNKQDVVPETLAPPIRDFDSLMQLYHQKVADVKSLGEQLAEQNDEYWNEVARRELRQDQEDQLSVTESEFEAGWKRREEELTQELSQAIDEVTRVRAECIIASDKSVDFGPEDFPDLRSFISPDMGLESKPGFEQSLQGALSRIPPEAFENAEVIHADDSDNISDTEGDTGITDMVSQWRDSVSARQLV
ncbi:hypothetical protein Q7P37_005638 [Cladosporium fusiforme]